jgi:hypothetical protein
MRWRFAASSPATCRCIPPVVPITRRTPVLLLLALAGCGPQYRVKLRATEVLQPTVAFQVPLPRELEVQFHSGLLVLEPGPELRCTLTVDVTARSLDELARLRYQIRPAIDEAADGSKTTIAVALPEGAPLESFQTTYQLQVPAQIRVRVRTRHGNVNVRGYRGSLEVEGGSGRQDIRLDGGSAQLQSVDGRVELRGSYRFAEIHTDSGRIDLELPAPGLALDLLLGSESGEIRVDMQTSQNLDVRFHGEVEQVRSDPAVRIEWNEVQLVDGVQYHIGRFGDLNAPMDGRIQLQTNAGVFLQLAPNAKMPSIR